MSSDETPVPAPSPDHVSARVVLFDFDGVLMHGDAFALFARERYARSLGCKLMGLLSAPGLILLLPFSRNWPLRLLARIALLGMSERTYRRKAEEFAGVLVRRPRQFCRDGVRALRRHQAAGDRVIVVTGCEHHLVSSVLSQLGLSDLEIVASQLRPSWIGMRLLRHNVGARKVQSLAQYGVTAWQLAYSDSLQDAPMLKPAGEAVLVNGTPRLCKKVEKALGRTVTRVAWY
jgi:phosphatidylglycerophosphatase C